MSILWKFCYAVHCKKQNAERLKTPIIHNIIVEAAVMQLLFIYACIVLNPSLGKWFVTEQSVVISRQWDQLRISLDHVIGNPLILFKRIPEILQMEKVLHIAAISQPVLKRTMRNMYRLCDVFSANKASHPPLPQSEVCVFQISFPTLQFISKLFRSWVLSCCCSWHVVWRLQLLNQREFCKSSRILCIFFLVNGLFYGVQFAVRAIQIIQVCKCKGTVFLMLRSRWSFVGGAVLWLPLKKKSCQQHR